VKVSVRLESVESGPKRSGKFQSGFPKQTTARLCRQR
jgi:hypothetical protein